MNQAYATLDIIRRERPHTYAAGLVDAYTRIRDRGEDPFSIRARLVEHVQQLVAERKIRRSGERADSPTLLERYAGAVEAVSATAAALDGRPRGSQDYTNAAKRYRAAEIELKRLAVPLIEEASRSNETPLLAEATAPRPAAGRRTGRGGAER